MDDQDDKAKAKALEIAKRHEERVTKKKEEEQRQMEMFLPEWPVHRRAMPNEYARAPIFTVRRGTRFGITNKPIYLYGDGEITYTGPELRACDDELVWLQIVSMAKQFPLGSWIEFTYYEICKAIGWANNGKNYSRIHDCLLRLKATAAAISNSRLGSGKAVSFVEAYEWKDVNDEKLQRVRVKISSGLAALFADRHFTELEWGKYIKLTPLARRLYDWAASHRAPFNLSLETLKTVVGSDAKTARSWKQQVVNACAELSDADLVLCWVEGNEVAFNRSKALT